MTARKARKGERPHFAQCRECGPLPLNPYWGPKQSAGSHQSVRGHKVDLMVVEG